MIEGGCFCGEIRYGIDEGEYLSANCHCGMCRRIHSAPYVAWLVVPVPKFRYTKGIPTEFHSSKDGTRYYCPDCGTHVACTNVTHPDIIDVAVGSLDQPEPHAPTMAIFSEDKLSWITL